jgi:hypothetical protein
LKTEIDRNRNLPETFKVESEWIDYWTTVYLEPTIQSFILLTIKNEK